MVRENGERLPEGLVVIADSQYAGRGQQGTEWVSEPGMNLTFSVLLYPKFLLPPQIFYLNKAIAVAVRNAVGALCHHPHVWIKWPNDIYAGNKKIAGTLIENGFTSTTVQYSIIGIGLNVNQEEFDVSVPHPVSLKQIANKEFDLQDVLEDVCSSIEQSYLLLRAFDFKKIDDEYHAHLYGMNKEMEFREGENQFSGVITGVDGNGKLIIDTAGGVRKLQVKEVSYIK